MSLKYNIKYCTVLCRPLGMLISRSIDTPKLSSSLFYFGFKMTLTFDCFCNNTEKENFDHVKSRCNSITAKPLLNTPSPKRISKSGQCSVLKVLGRLLQIKALQAVVYQNFGLSAKNESFQLSAFGFGRQN